MANSKPATTECSNAPWVRLTYIYDDEMLMRLKLGLVIMHCTGCGGFSAMQYPLQLIATEESGAAECRVAFEHLHKNCKELV